MSPLFHKRPHDDTRSEDKLNIVLGIIILRSISDSVILNFNCLLKRKDPMICKPAHSKLLLDFLQKFTTLLFIFPDYKSLHSLSVQQNHNCHDMRE